MIILHIPHSSTRIPYLEGYSINENELQEEQLLLTDWHTDDLFSYPAAVSIIAGFSRIFCDVERFPEDKDEIMSAQGMGALYEKRDDGSRLRNVSSDLRSGIMNEFYLPHHKRLEDAVAAQLKQFGKSLIIDCHSFTDIPLRRDLDQDKIRPDYCLGTDPFHTSGELINVAEEFFIRKNLSLGLNKPYTGSMVPAKYYRKDPTVQSIMLEINRKLYLESGTNNKSNNYSNVKETVNEFITIMLKHSQ